MIEIADLHGKARYRDAVFAHSGVHRANLSLQPRKNRHNILKQLRSIGGFDFYVDAMRQPGVIDPLCLENALRRGVHVGDVGTVRAMYADAASDRHVSDDRIAGYRRAAFGEAHQNVVHAGDPNAAGTAHALSERRLSTDFREVDDVIVLDLVADAIRDGLRGRIAETDCREEIGRRGIVQPGSDSFEQLAPRNVRAQSGPGEFLLERLLPG